MFRNPFSSPSSGLALDDILELANAQLGSARNANVPAKALLLCNNAKAMIKDAENIAGKKKTKSQAVNSDIANAYQEHGKLLEGLGQYSEAQKSYSKAQKWGYIHASGQQGHSSQPTNIDGPIAAPSTIAHRGPVKDMTSAAVKDQISVTSKDTTQVRRAIYIREVASPVAKFELPEPNGRFTSTSQLAYCLSLMRASLTAKEGLVKAECDWLNPDEQERLQMMATDIIRAFVRDELKGLDVVAETVSLAAVLDQDNSRKLLGVFVNGIEQSVLLNTHLLKGLAYLLKNTPQGNVEADDLVKILELLSMRLKDTHQRSIQHIYQITEAISCLLDSMVDSQVEGIEREQLHEPLAHYLKGLQQSPDPCLLYQASYAYQALRYIPNDETFLKAMVRRTGKVVKGVSGIVSAVKALDLDGFIKGLDHIHAGMASAGEAITMANDAFQNASALVETTQGTLESLNEGLSFTRKSVWYPALRGLDALLREGRLAEFERLAREAPCQQDPAFQWGVCQRLGELAASATWDIDIRQCAVSFLEEMHTNDVQWGQQISVKQWILRILGSLAELPEGPIAVKAKTLLQELETDGDSRRRAIYQDYIKEDRSPRILATTMPSPQKHQLLDIVQNKPDVEGPLRQLKQERLRERGQDIYISPRAKLNRSAKEDFDLTSKVQEFLKSDKKVFLLLGDSGAGKSTFNRAIEVDLWDKYNKTDKRIPLFIHLPTIEKLERDLIAERLRRANFTENQIRELKLHREFILICDGYDESQQTRNLYMSNQLNQPGGWHAQMVISCRTEYTGFDYRDCFWPIDHGNRGNPQLFQEAILTPFDKSQIQAYIDQYVPRSKPLWTTMEYLKALKQIPNLLDLVTNPFLLKIAVDVLPKFVGAKNDFSQICITRVQLYDSFVQQWIERNKIRLGEIELNPRDKEALVELQGSGFNQHCIEYLKELATAIYDNQDGNPVIKYSDHRDQKTWKKTFFDNNDGKNLLREAIPLVHNTDQYSFTHRSILEYGLTLAVFEPSEHNEDAKPESNPPRRGSTCSILSFEEHALIEKPVVVIEQPLLDSPFGRRRLVDEPTISQFLVERAQQQPIFKEQLHASIERSKAEKMARVAAANAITVLVRAGVQFNGTDLRDIKIPGADLSYGMFDSAQLVGADLRKVNLHNIWLRNANLRGAQLTGVHFGELPFLQENTVVSSCAYSQDGRVFAAGLGDGCISLYRTSGWERLHTLTGHTDYVGCLAFSETGGQIASGSRDGDVRLWDVESGHCIHVLQGHEDDVNSVVFSPNGDHIASGGEDNTVRLWDVESGKSAYILQDLDDFVTRVMYSPSGGQIVFGGEDSTVRLWDPEAGDDVDTFQGYGSQLTSIAYLKNGDQIATGNEHEKVYLWNVKTGNIIHTLEGHGMFVSCVVFSSNGDQLASASFDQTVRLWDVESGDCIHTFQGHSQQVYCAAYSPNGGQVASGSGDKTIRLWSLNTGNFTHVAQGHTDWVGSVAYSPNCCQIASGSLDQTVRLWDVETGVCVRTLHGHGEWVSCVAYSPNGNQVASGSDEKTVRLWDVETGDCTNTLKGHSSGVTNVVYSPNGNQIASGSKDHAGHSNRVTSAMYSPHGGQIVTGSWDKTVRLWDAKTGQCIRILQGHDELVTSVVYSPSGELVASRSDDKTVRLWNVENSVCVHVLQGHNDVLGSLAFSPTEDQIATGSDDGTMRLWDVKTGRNLITVYGFNGAVNSIVWENASKGKYLVTASTDKSVRRWKVVKEQDEYTVRLCWGSSHDALTVYGASFTDVRGLDRANLTLLRQREASVDSFSPIS
ncbi:hypothetical protein BGZ80_009949 [Entomortierella chlamydospora]|uniref:Arm-like repeat domain-containing protein n=1 Tax=Entomortierella chlamydospora TaxID=101097 RepID=A0A9P6MW34_9FUNG|nr:hypothetical protein BGZ80_009949 [Entomortierella chlamydospora]